MTPDNDPFSVRGIAWEVLLSILLWIAVFLLLGLG
jgi:hypothetical protein